MPTFRESFCAQQRCPTDQFERRVFWRCLYPHARLVAWLILWMDYDYFSADRQLISGAGDAPSMRRVRDEVRDFFWSSDNRGWWRRTAKVRVSGQRLRNLAARYLQDGDPSAEKKLHGSDVPFPAPPP
ncbi:hypothetical protein [Opitutus terrae]|uniref:Uncharacterized protein n=1 Tax=Opitutus terrae (strain DSM 11246 / JCM 15787 / PB90-1) TaxID=452637 RepID=B1ZTC3_OPITP|nr:hypothetical protein [Opitutus terrae]ACB76577.1 hypothetical protein Oter_3298 [Opitutus terrae PB90-1]